MKTNFISPLGSIKNSPLKIVGQMPTETLERLNKITPVHDFLATTEIGKKARMLGVDTKPLSEMTSADFATAINLKRATRPEIIKSTDTEATADAIASEFKTMFDDSGKIKSDTFNTMSRVTKRSELGENPTIMNFVDHYEV